MCAVIPGFGLVLGLFAVTKCAGTAATCAARARAAAAGRSPARSSGVGAIAASIAIPIVFGFPL